MDHAGDIAWKLARGFPETMHGIAFAPSGDLERQTFIVQSVPSWFRVTVEEIEPTEDELYAPTLADTARATP